mgnify:CR=1 FL=1
MEQLKSLTEGFLQNQIIPLAATVIIMGVIIVGFSFMAGRKARDWGREHILWLVIGAALVYSGFNIGQSISSAFGF